MKLEGSDTYTRHWCLPPQDLYCPTHFHQGIPDRPGTDAGKRHGLCWHSHGFLAGGEICKLRYGLLSESSRRLYFWRPPRTRSRRTPVGEEREVSEAFSITRGVNTDFGISALAKSFRATLRWPFTAAPHLPQARWLDNPKTII